jgi:hypothetical protein
MQNRYIIRIHSFVDLITNSSTELFVSATDKSADTVREVINNILSLGGSTLRADDLFKIELVIEDPDAYPTKTYPVDSDKGRSIKKECSSDNGPTQAIQLTPIVNTDAAKQAAKVLSSLNSLFTIEESYN